MFVLQLGLYDEAADAAYFMPSPSVQEWPSRTIPNDLYIDLEATRTDITQDRIVDLAKVYAHGDVRMT